MRKVKLRMIGSMTYDWRSEKNGMNAKRKLSAAVIPKLLYWGA